ncbi:MAG: MFS transporter [Actinomycetota bacterium]|nr:MFS transporter [Actinomycetota bacterium]
MSFAGDLSVVLRLGGFRRLYATRLTSQLADGVFQVALASVFFFAPERQTSAGRIAAAFAVLLLPYSLAGPFAGVLLDRWRRRQVLMWANLARSAMVVGVAALVGAGVVGAPLYVAVLASVSVNRFFLAGLSAALPHVVPRDELVMANSVSTTSGTIAAMCGGGAGFALRAVLGTGTSADVRLALIAATLYLGSALVARSMHPDLLGPDAGTAPGAQALRGVVVGMAEGARHVWARRAAGHALAAITAHRFCYGVTTIAAVLLYRNHFNDPADTDAGLSGLAAVVAVSGAGFLAAAVATPEVTEVTGRVTKPRWIVACFALAALTAAVYVVHLSQLAVVLGAFVLGFAAHGSKICVDTIVQESVDDDFRGRVFSFYDVLFNMSFLAAAAFAAVAVPPSGASAPVYALVAAGYGLTATAYGRAARAGADERLGARVS